MASTRRNRQRASKRRVAKQGEAVDTDAAPWHFSALFTGGLGGTPHRYERSDLCLARRAIRADWLPADADAKRVALVEHFASVMRRHQSDRLALTALSCLITCDLANLRNE